MSVTYGLNRTNGLPLSQELAFDDPNSHLPIVPLDVLDQILPRLVPKELKLVLQHQIVPVAWLPDRSFFAAVEGLPLQTATDLDFRPIAWIKKEDFRASIRRSIGRKLLSHATSNLKEKQPQFSADRRLTTPQMMIFTIVALTYSTFIALAPFDISFAITSLLLTMFFLGVTALRLMCVMEAKQPTSFQTRKLSDEELPVYSVLVPVFRETRVLGQLLAALTQLDYPALCIKRTKTE